VSVTCYYAPEELDAVREYLGEHWGQMKSVSFLRQEDHGYDQAPLEAIDTDRYLDLVSRIDDSVQMTLQGFSTLLDGEECATGACPIR